jgi:hypothetical protein
MAQQWQEIDAPWQVCHSWQDQNERRITAMALLMIIVAVSILTTASWLTLYLVQLVKNDGYGRLDGSRTFPRSHEPDPFDPRFRSRHA